MSKKRKFFAASSGSVAIGDRLSNAPLHFLRLAAQHRGLVGHADRLQVHVGIETGRIGASEFLQERLLVAAVPDVIANVIGIGESQNHEVMPLPSPSARELVALVSSCSALP